MTRLLVATSNAGKVKELVPLLADLGWTPCGLDEFPDVPIAEETGATFAENARAKALYYAAATGMAVLADDSGLEVDALDGEPGVHSARFAGEICDDQSNNALLQQRLSGVSDRSARFRCCVCLVEDGMVSFEVHGCCEGRIASEPRGEQGFGYDPLFVPSDPSAGGATFGELIQEQKSALSHRGQAMAALARALASRADEAPQ